ncbi:MAG: DUF4214 domain-containing protein [Pseudomonadota bacterium]
MATIAGTLDVAGDEDWVRADLEAGISYRIAVEDAFGAVSFSVQSQDDPGFDDPDFRRFDFPIQQQTVVTPELGGAFFIAVDGFEEQGYTVTVEEQVDDFADNPLTTAFVAPGGSLQGTHEVVGDDDWVRMSLSAGVTYRIAVEQSDPSDFLTLSLMSREDSVFSAGRTRDDFSPFFGNFVFDQNEIVLTPLRSADYFLSVIGTAGDYTVSLEDIADDFADNENTTGTIAVGSTATGRIDAVDDEDWFRVELAAGVTYRTNGDATSFVDPAAIFDDDLFSVGVDQLPRAETSGVFTPELGGTYFIAVQDDAASVGETYTLELAVQEDDFADNRATTGSIAPGQQVSGLIEIAGDEDWFAADLAGGVTYRARLELENPGDFDRLNVGSEQDDEFFDTETPLRSEFGFSQFDAPGVVEAIFTPLNGGRYFIQVPSDTLAGAYTVSLDVVDDDFADNAGTTGSLSVGGTATGTIENQGDQDWFRVDLQAGVSYLVTTQADDVDLSFAIGQELVVTDQDGEFPDDFRFEFSTSDFLAETQNAQTVLTPLESATFFVQVWGDRGTGDYTVSVVEQEDDFADTSGTTGVVDLSDDGGAPSIGEGLTPAEAREVALLYETGLDRDGDIDLPGLNFWIDQREGGFSIEELAQFFLDSEEFAAAFGDPDNLSDQALVEQLYLNVLDRPGEPAGVDFWTGVAASPEFSRAELLFEFAVSVENAETLAFVETLAETSAGEWEFVA